MLSRNSDGFQPNILRPAYHIDMPGIGLSPLANPDYLRQILTDLMHVAVIARETVGGKLSLSRTWFIGGTLFLHHADPHARRCFEHIVLCQTRIHLSRFRRRWLTTSL